MRYVVLGIVAFALVCLVGVEQSEAGCCGRQSVRKAVRAPVKIFRLLRTPRCHNGACR